MDNRETLMRTVHFFATYYEQEHSSQTLIQSLLMQTADNWKLTICSNADDSVLNLNILDPRVNIILKGENTGFWGALNRRDFIIDSVGDNEMLINTSCEDYYIKTLVEEINKKDEDFVMWDHAHHHFKYNTISAVVQPKRNKIDWGSYAVKGSVAKQAAINTDIETWKEFTADGQFVENIMQIDNLKVVRLPKILFVKN
jgi:hypothetical protein